MTDMEDLEKLKKIINESSIDIDDSNLLCDRLMGKNLISKKEIQLLSSQCLVEIKKSYNKKVKIARRDITWHTTSNYPILICRVETRVYGQPYNILLCSIHIDPYLGIEYVKNKLLKVISECFEKFVNRNNVNYDRGSKVIIL